MKYTTTETARLLNRSPERIRQAIRDYNIGVKFGRDWQLTAAEVEVIRARLGAVGRPCRGIKRGEIAS